MQFGEKIQITHILKRKKEWKKHPKWEFPNVIEHKSWESLSYSQGEGIVIGKRTLSNGYNEYHPETGNIFHPQEHFQAYLVAVDMRKNPVYVKIEEK